MAEAHESDRAALERQREVWRKQAAGYDRAMGFWEWALFRGVRPWLCSQARGNVLDLAVGTGRNFDYYPADVHLVGIDLSPEMIALARHRADHDSRSVDLQEGNAQSLNFPDASFDTVVCTFSMCNIPDQEQALGEMHRVLRPGGRLLLVDHVASTNTVVLTVQRILETLTLRFSAEHLTRRPAALLSNAGFEVETCRRHHLGIVEEVVARRQV